MYDDNNIFAKIIRGEAPSAKVFESAHSLAFNDKFPNARTHILVVPKGPYEDIADFTARAPAEEQLDFWKAVLSVAKKAGVRNNFRLQANTGKGAGQAVPHFHVHILSN